MQQNQQNKREYDSDENKPRTSRFHRALTDEIGSNPYFLCAALIGLILVVLLLVAVYVR